MITSPRACTVALLGGRVTSVFQRALHHVKLGVKAGTIETKAYLAVAHRWAGALPAA